MKDIILVAVLAVILVAAARYLHKAKKSGARCVGCSVGEGGCCCCGGAEQTDDAPSSCCCQSEKK